MYRWHHVLNLWLTQYIVSFHFFRCSRTSRKTTNRHWSSYGRRKWPSNSWWNRTHATNRRSDVNSTPSMTWAKDSATSTRGQATCTNQRRTQTLDATVWRSWTRSRGQSTVEQVWTSRTLCTDQSRSAMADSAACLTFDRKRVICVWGEKITTTPPSTSQQP